ncbi:hypothetical protein CBM2599_P160002 [Cupriavidus taiwanensis]|nr:hypothetical protein CBM2585_P160002 [Cupriavidus taiwanensis]SOY99202.1 hypothetical protein CBM2591_P190002 [Cupriavidus taiwanensis]SOZ06793.1 hypothetical protein CBM2599_P160002 [Cupriavidus taiwanensis]SOZ16275.1 hypothetical protein CBM2597_P110002 [Cupriavidus taiwanensis]SPA37087.1 hypothetical protein CBM2623_P170002 [Cupriavidus taiwanensis]
MLPEVGGLLMGTTARCGGSPPEGKGHAGRAGTASPAVRRLYAITASDESCRLGGTKKSAASRAFCSGYLRIFQRSPISALSLLERAYSTAGDLRHAAHKAGSPM